MWAEVYIAFGIQWIAWVFAFIYETEKFYDLMSSITFITIVVYNFLTRATSLAASQLIQMFCVLVWTIRLGAFLYWRILNKGEDRRFREIKTNPIMFLAVWTMQGVWVLMTLLPSLLMWRKTSLTASSSTAATIGWVFWVIGLALEVIADYQKSEFRSQLENKGRFIQTGVWSLCRHPNYLGEILLWFGLLISASSTFSLPDYFSVIGPLFDAILIIYVSGIPILETYADKKWGADSLYLRYKHKTSLLIPYVW